MTDKSVEEVVEEIQEDLDKEETSKSNRLTHVIKQVKNWLYEYNGFLLKKNGWLSKSEVHAVGMPATFISSAYMLNGLGIVVFGMFFLMYRRGFKLAEDPKYEGHWNDVIDESAYTGGSLMATIIIWQYYFNQEISGAEHLISFATKAAFGV